jgi:hypothetical protein
MYAGTRSATSFIAFAAENIYLEGVVRLEPHLVHFMLPHTGAHTSLTKPSRLREGPSGRLAGGAGASL